MPSPLRRIEPEACKVPGYSITRQLGEGGMATVYLAVQHSLEREVALKVMSPLLKSDPGFAARFKREARIVAQLSHASIVPVFDVGPHYLSMEYLCGGDLKQRILEGPLEASAAAKICASLCAALDAAHRKGFVHRDIKPENILFREDGTPVLTDFGIARALDVGRSMTVAGMLVGTPAYMSPEQVKGLELDGRSDLYSLGVVFYEMLTGAVPFKADSTLSVALMQVSNTLPPLPPQYAAYQEFLDYLTAKDREERFASGAEVIRTLQLLANRRPPRSPPPSPTPAPVPRKRPLWPVAGGLAAVVTAMTLIVAGLNRTPSIPPHPKLSQPGKPLAIAEPELIPVPVSLPPLLLPLTPPPAVAPTAQHQQLAQRRDQRRAEQARVIGQRAAVLHAAQLQEQDARVQDLLISANTEYAAGALWEPPGANAADHYREILEIQPQRTEAIAGAQRVANLLALEAAQTAATGDVYTTRLLIDRIQTLQPDHPRLADLHAQLEQMLTAPATLGARERERLGRAATYIAHANTDLGRDRVDFRAIGEATAQYDKAVSIASTAPGLPSLQERLVAAYVVAIRTELAQNPDLARKLLNAAHKHRWSSADLDQLDVKPTG
jgi:serine/threonine protein kinase